MYTLSGHLELAPVEVVPGEADPEPDPRHEQLLAVVHCLPEDDVILLHGNLVIIITIIISLIIISLITVTVTLFISQLRWEEGCEGSLVQFNSRRSPI